MRTVTILVIFFLVFSFCSQALAQDSEEYGPDSDNYINHPIIDAAYDDNWNKVIAIAKKDKNALYETDFEQAGVLAMAAMHANDAVVIALLKLGADKNAKDISMRRPYDYARENKKISPKVLKMLK